MDKFLPGRGPFRIEYLFRVVQLIIVLLWSSIMLYHAYLITMHIKDVTIPAIIEGAIDLYEKVFYKEYYLPIKFFFEDHPQIQAGYIITEILVFLLLRNIIFKKDFRRNLWGGIFTHPKIENSYVFQVLLAWSCMPLFPFFALEDALRRICAFFVKHKLNAIIIISTWIWQKVITIIDIILLTFWLMIATVIKYWFGFPGYLVLWWIVMFEDQFLAVLHAYHAWLTYLHPEPYSVFNPILHAFMNVFAVWYILISIIYFIYKDDWFDVRNAFKKNLRVWGEQYEAIHARAWNFVRGMEIVITFLWLNAFWTILSLLYIAHTIFAYTKPYFIAPLSFFITTFGINSLSAAIIFVLLFNLCFLWFPRFPRRLPYRLKSPVFSAKQLTLYMTKGLLALLIPFLVTDFFKDSELSIILIYNIGVLLLFLICIVNTSPAIYKPKLYYTFLHLTSIALIGAFSTHNLIYFYIFFELSLIPIFFLIIVWGSRSEKASAGFQLFLYTIFGSFLFLQGLLTLVTWQGTVIFPELISMTLPPKVENFVFLCIFIGFMVKIPMFPFHIWLPKAHVEAPTAGSVLLAGVILKLGSYVFLRFFPILFPTALNTFRPYIVVLTVLGLLYTSFTIIRQIDIKRIVAYSSIGHMNLVTYGCLCGNINSYYGAFLLSIAHGLASGGMFGVVGSIYDRLGTRNILYLRAITEIMPLTAFFFFAFALANIGFPPTLNFVSELMILTGILQESYLYATVAIITMIISGISTLWILTKIFFGNFLFLDNTLPQRAFVDLQLREIVAFAALLFFILFLSFITTTLVGSLRTMLLLF